MTDAEILRRATGHAVAYLESLDSRQVATTATAEELRERLGGVLPESGIPAEQVIDDLVRDVEGGILGSTGGRFFGWVIGGALPAAVAADWLTTAWDQNAAAYACGPAEAVVEEVCGAWLKELLGIPPVASFAFVTGCQMAHATALAAARHKLLRDRGWDVEERGLAGAPPIRIVTNEDRHESIIRAVRLLGIGTGAMELLPCVAEGGIRMDLLEDALEAAPENPTILCLSS